MHACGQLFDAFGAPAAPIIRLLQGSPRQERTMKTNTLMRLALLAGRASATLGAQAQLTYPAERWWDNRWYVSPFVQFTFPDAAREAKNGVGYGLAAGKPITPSWDLELRGAWESMGADGAPSDWRNWTFEVDGKWYFLGRTGLAKWDGLQPYGLVGLGAIHDSVGGSSKLSGMATAGVGVALPLAKWGRLYIDGRYRWDGNSGKLVSQNSFGDWLLSVGVTIPLGAVPGVEQPAAVKAPPPPPAAAPAPARPAPVLVAPPPVTRTFDISADGMFAFGKADLSPVGKSRIENMIEGMRQAGITGLTALSVIGHTDPIGTAESNQVLSRERADAVKAYLVSRGIPADIITAEGRGESQLKVTEEQCRAKGQASPRSALIACRAPNRRVEVIATAVQSKP
jgi:OOP family OmpA-OmpF porin